MKRLFLVLLAFVSLCAVARADKNTVLIHPGDEVYVRFDVKGKKIHLGKVSAQKDEGAQVIITFDKDPKNFYRTLKIENKFPRDLVYKLEMRSIAKNHQARAKPTPVVGGKVAFDTYPAMADELALYDFKLED